MFEAIMKAAEVLGLSFLTIVVSSLVVLMAVGAVWVLRFIISKVPFPEDDDDDDDYIFLLVDDDEDIEEKIEQLLNDIEDELGEDEDDLWK